MAQVTVATLNLFNREGRWPQRAPLVVRQFLEIGPDVVGFQEVDHTIDQANWLVTWLNGELGRQDYTAYHIFNPRGVSHFESLAVVTRLPVLEHEGLDYLRKNNIAQRVCLRLDQEAILDFYNTHLYWFPNREGSRIRTEEVQRLLQWMARCGEDRPRVVVGDFNAVPTGRTVTLMKKAFRSAYEVAHGQEPERTWPSPLASTVDAMRSYGVASLPPNYFGAIDYIFVSPEVKVLEARLSFHKPDAVDATLYPSDHFGLMARLQVPAGILPA